MATKKIQDADALLLFKVGPVYVCAPTLTVEAVILPPKLTHAPGYNEAEPGVFRHQCGLVHVVDLRKRFGIEPDKWLSPGKIIIVEIEGGYAGFWVDEILDVVHFPEKGWSNVPACIPRDVFRRTLLLDDVIQLYCDFEGLFRFKETGYLREFIAGLELEKEKQLEADEGDGAKNIVSRQADLDIADKKKDEPTVKKQMNEDYVVSDEMSSPEAIDAVEHNIGRDMKNTGRPSELQLEAIDQPGINQQQTPIDSVVKKDNPDSDKAKLDIAPSRNHQPQNVVSEITGKESNPSKPFQESNEPDGKAAVYFWTVFAGIFIALFVTGYFVLSRMDKGLDVKQKTTDTLLKRNQILDQTAEDVNPDLGQVIEEQEVNYAEIIRSEEGVTIVVNEAENIVTEDTDSQAEVEGLMNSETNEIKISSRLLEVEVEVEVETEKEIVSREIVHVVVKGDTLWHIAKRYIKNPYHYPQLARLSKIKNPDLIYPGDKVRIIMNNQRE